MGEGGLPPLAEVTRGVKYSGREGVLFENMFLWSLMCFTGC